MFTMLSAEATAALASGPFETQTELTNIAMAVSPPGLIADVVSPRIPAPYKFAYTKLDTADRLSIPDSRASRAGRVTEVEFGSTDAVDQTEDWALACAVPDRDIDEARKQNASYDPLAVATDALTTLMKLDREKRVVDQVFDTGSYAAGYHATLAGGSQWSHADSNPLAAILEKMDVPLVRPNTLVLGQQTWTKLRQHPKIVEGVNMSGAGDKASGAATMKAVAELLELDYVAVGRVQHQTARRGQDEVYSYMWGKHAALLHVNRALSGMQSAMPSFSFTAEAMALAVGTYQDASRGIRNGSTVVKASMSCKELTAWSKAGYLWKNAVA